MRIETLTQAIETLGLDGFCERYKIKATRGVDSPMLVSLKYRAGADFNDPIVCLCRGIILNEAAGWAVVSWPYNKFFNATDPKAAAIDWSTASVTEKSDGSLCTLYPHDGTWHVSTSGTPDGSGATEGPHTFAELFWQTWAWLGYELPEIGPRCYMFELCTPSNRIVVQYDAPRIVHHGSRCLETGQEALPDLDTGWECAAVYPIEDLAAAQDSAATMHGLRAEGFVVVDASFNRIKVKAPSYVALHASKSHGATRQRLIALLQSGSEETKAFLKAFPEFDEQVQDIAGSLCALRDDIQRSYWDHQHLETQKAFALAIADLPYRAALFALRARKAPSAAGWIMEQKPAGLIRLLEA